MRSGSPLHTRPGLLPVSYPVVSAPLYTCFRGFYSGLDDNRVQRLRRSGITFNKPRGRDTLSLAFESRIRVLPLNTIGDLYGPVEPPSHDVHMKREASLPGPRHGDGEGDHPASHTRTATANNPSQASEESPAEKEWRVLVVEPLESWQVEVPVPYPSPHPSLYADWRAVAEASTSGGSYAGCLDWKPLAKHLLNPFEQETPLQLHGGAVGASAVAGDTHTVNAVTLPEKERFLHWGSTNRRHLRQNGDTSLFPSSFPARFLRPKSSGADGAATVSTTHRQEQQQQQVRFFLSMVIDPFIDLERFRREEAQVELITGFRNVFYEAAELPDVSVPPQRIDGSMVHPRKVADVVRIPALSVYSCGPRFFDELGKLNQQSIIKGFHRISNEAKEKLILNKNFTVELYVPPLLLDQFETAFEDEAWEVPQSTLNPGRTALYPGLPPPRSLLTYDGWIGKRPELVEAIETEGRSLMRGKKYGLDGREIQEQEVLSHIRVFGAREEETRRLTDERETAQRELGPEAMTRANAEVGLRPGLLQDYEEPKPSGSTEKPSSSS